MPLRFLLAAGSMTALAFSAGVQVHPETARGPLLLVANQGDRSISIVDATAGREIATVPEGGVTGHEVAASPDGRTAYVPIYGSSGVGQPGSDGRIMDVIDIPTRKVIGTVDFGRGVRPHCPIYDRNTGLLYVTTELEQAVAIIDPRTLKIVGSIPTSQAESHMLALSRDGKRGYTANVGPGTVSVLDMVARKTIKVIPISATTQRISISGDDSMVFTADQTAPRLAVIDTSTNRVKTWVPMPALGYGTAPTKDGHWLLVAMPSANQVAVIDIHTLKLVRTVDVPTKPTEILARPDGRVAYISCGGSHQVAVLDLLQWKVRSLIDAGRGADGLAWVR